MSSNRELTESFMEFAKDKGIDRPTMISVLEEVFRTMIRKRFTSDENFDIIINADGDLEIFQNREIVEDNAPELNDPARYISLSEARKIEPDFEVGEEIAKPIGLEEFGRRIVMTGRQTLIQKIKDLEKEGLFEKYKDLVGEIISG